MKRILITVLLMSIVIFVSAETNEYFELARKMIGSIDIKNVYQTAAIAATTQMQGGIHNAIGRSISDAEKQRLIFFWYKHIKELVPQKVLEDGIISILTKNITMQEAKEINEFYKTPIGIKYLSLQPKMMKEAEGFGAELGEKLSNTDVIEPIINDMIKEFPSWFPSN